MRETLLSLCGLAGIDLAGLYLPELAAVPGPLVAAAVTGSVAVAMACTPVPGAGGIPDHG